MTTMKSGERTKRAPKEKEMSKKDVCKKHGITTVKLEEIIVRYTSIMIEDESDEDFEDDSDGDLEENSVEDSEGDFDDD